MPAQTTRTGWWAESISNGGAHYGTRQLDHVTVRSACDRAFVPLSHPWTREAEPRQEPADAVAATQAAQGAVLNRIVALLEQRETRGNE